LQFEQLKRLRDLNVQLLETTIQFLQAIDEYCRKQDIPLPTEDKLIYLAQEAINLCQEINEEIDLPPFLQHRFRTPPDKTEPSFKW